MIMKYYIDSKGNKCVDRRAGSDRRVNPDRRRPGERRHDYRSGTNGKRRSLRTWLRSFSNSRMGVDRRKGERRQIPDRRQPTYKHLLTKEELHDLLTL